MKNFERRKAQFLAILEKANATGTAKSINMDYEEAFFGAKGVTADEGD